MKLPNLSFQNITTLNHEKLKQERNILDASSLEVFKDRLDEALIWQAVTRPRSRGL